MSRMRMFAEKSKQQLENMTNSRPWSRKLKMVWPRLKVFWLRKDDFTGQSERKKKKREAEEELGRQY